VIYGRRFNYTGVSMSEVQHREARRLISIIADAQSRGSPELTYQSVALELGRLKTSARMVAQVCDLLDAAAATAGIPLLALVAVREKSGAVNKQAWATNVPPSVRKAIIKRSENHKFLPEDFAALVKALDSLVGLGNRKAWERLKQLMTTEELRQRVMGIGPLASLDAINDIGTDTPSQGTANTSYYIRNQSVRIAVKKRARGRCEYCDKPGFECLDGSPYLEAHHIIALANDGADRMTNVIALCANDHREAHFGRRSIELEKEMIEIVRKKRG
jgi:hypothetical protein